VNSAMLTAIVTLASIAAIYATALAVASRSSRQFPRAAAPMLAALALGAGLVLPAFAIFEPAHGGEALGTTLPALAVAGAALVAIWTWRAARMLLVSRRVTAAWARHGAPIADDRWGVPAVLIDTGAPVVAVAGLLKPRLFVDRSVLELCTGPELDAIAAHEQAHVRSRDNVRRLLVGVCAGPRSEAAAAWRAAAEHEADRSAARSPRAALDLAAALVKLARARRIPSWHDAVLSTVHDGGSLESRVHRLLAVDGHSGRAAGDSGAAVWVASAALLAAAGGPRLLQLVHAGLEVLVQRLP
jgi:Peptidase family M48